MHLGSVGSAVVELSFPSSPLDSFALRCSGLLFNANLLPSWPIQYLKLSL